MKLLKVQEKDRRILSDLEERRLIEHAAPHLKPLIQFALHTGLRRGELFGLDWADVDQERGVVRVRRQTKSYRNRTVPLNPEAMAVLESLPERTGTVFRFKGDAVHNTNVAMRSACRRAGIERCGLHSCRHTFATRLVRAGVPLASVKKLLGHASVKTTMHYAHLVEGDLVDAAFALSRTARKVQDGASDGAVAETARNVVSFDSGKR